MIFRREFCGREASFVSFPVYFVMPILCVHCLAQTCALTMQLLLPCLRSSDELKCCLSSDFFLFSGVFSCVTIHGAVMVVVVVTVIVAITCSVVN